MQQNRFKKLIIEQIECRKCDKISLKILNICKQIFKQVNKKHTLNFVLGEIAIAHSDYYLY